MAAVAKRRISLTTILIACLATMALDAGLASAQPRFDGGLLLGTTTTFDEAPVLDFENGTTEQATFAGRVWRSETVACLGGGALHSGEEKRVSRGQTQSEFVVRERRPRN